MAVKFKHHKWLINWIAFSCLLTVLVVFAIAFENKPWIGNVLQSIGTIAGIYLTLIIFFRSKEDSDKQFRNHLEYLQNLTIKQIDALHSSTEKQLLASHNLTEKQIEALHATTQSEIVSFEKQTKEIANKLIDNSVLLAELLSRELENSLNHYNNIIAQEQTKYSTLEGFILLRTPEERDQQLKVQWSRIEQFKKYYDRLVHKYNQNKYYLTKKGKLL